MEERGDAGLVTLDLRGQVCPSTLLKALRQLNLMKDGLKTGASTLVILLDHRDATVTVPDAATSMGYRATVIREGPHYKVRIESGK